MRACGRDVALVLALAAPAAGGPSPETQLDAVRAHVRARQADIVREYAELLAIPNVPAEPEGLRRNAEHVAGMLRRRGLEARLLDGAGGPPLVYGVLDVGAPRTLALYAHYDGQPVRPEQWSSSPFTPVLRERFEAHLRAAGYTVVHQAPTPEERRRSPRLVRLEWEGGYPAARTPLGLPFSRALVRAVGAAGDGQVIVLPTLGGSVPLHVFADAFGVPVVGLPIVNHDNAQHAADENLRLRNLWDGITVFASVFASLGAAPEWR